MIGHKETYKRLNVCYQKLPSLYNCKRYQCSNHKTARPENRQYILSQTHNHIQNKIVESIRTNLNIAWERVYLPMDWLKYVQQTPDCIHLDSGESPTIKKKIQYTESNQARLCGLSEEMASACRYWSKRRIRFCTNFRQTGQWSNRWLQRWQY